jgi:hypothetical protein
MFCHNHWEKVWQPFLTAWIETALTELRKPCSYVRMGNYLNKFHLNILRLFWHSLNKSDGQRHKRIHFCRLLLFRWGCNNQFPILTYEHGFLSSVKAVSIHAVRNGCHTFSQWLWQNILVNTNVKVFSIFMVNILYRHRKKVTDRDTKGFIFVASSFLGGGVTIYICGADRKLY